MVAISSPNMEKMVASVIPKLPRWLWSQTISAGSQPKKNVLPIRIRSRFDFLHFTPLFPV